MYMGVLSPQRSLPRSSAYTAYDRGDRGSDRHALRQTRTHLVEWHVPLRERVDAAKVVDERVGVDTTEMTVGELRDEIRLVRNGELGVTVEHDAQQRRARATHAEDEDRRTAGRHGNCTGGRTVSCEVLARRAAADDALA